MIKDIHSHLLPIEGAYNVRDIGNYETIDGQLTKTGAFYRADSTAGFTAKDIEYFKCHDLSLVIDLRSAAEAAHSPSSFCRTDGIRYENIQIIDGIHSNFESAQLPETMGRLYIQFLESAKPAFAKIFRLFAQNRGAALYHCTAGKDRTGVVTMLLLSLAGLSDEDIIADYAATEIFTSHLIASQKAQLAAMGLDVPEFLLHADAENMRETVQYLHEKYENAENYLKSCNVTQEEIETVKNKLV